MEASFNREELWKIQGMVRNTEGGLYWKGEWMAEVHRCILYLESHPEVEEVNLSISDDPFWWHVVEQIPEGLTLGTDKLFGRRLLKKVMAVLEVNGQKNGYIPEAFKSAFKDSDGLVGV